MSILEHLEELRSRLLKSALSLVVAVAVAWNFSRQIYDFLVIPAMEALPDGIRLAYTGIADPFVLYLKVSLMAALFLAAPVVFAQFWFFVSPGLYKRERRWAIPFVVATTFFFTLGGAFSYKVILPLACRFFISVGNDSGFMPVITVKELLHFELQLILGTAIIFEMPIVVFFLTRVGVLTPAFLWHYFPHAMVALWLAAAWLTPPDVFSMILIGLPMMLLYLFSIGVCWVFLPRRPESESTSERSGPPPGPPGIGNESGAPPTDPAGTGEEG
jgi:sec-independent protein translocase protein TatC